MNETEIKKDEVMTLLQWFESNYSPGEVSENGRPKGASLLMKGIKGNIVLQLFYENDLLGESHEE